jgi:hypothetical protein
MKLTIQSMKDSPNTAMIMGALLSGGDTLALAKCLSEPTEQKETDGNVILAVQ